MRPYKKDQSNLAKIWKGLATSDTNRTFFGQIIQVISRFTWQLPNTLIGLTVSLVANILGRVNFVDHHGGATVINYGDKRFGAFTIGSYIIGDITIQANADDILFQHEYGHYLQSETVGPAYLYVFALPSLFSAIKNGHNGHKAFYTEIDSNRRAYEYWKRTIMNYEGWNNESNPV